MKTILSTILTFITAAAFAFTADIYLQWNANPAFEGVTKYVIYQAKAPSTNFVAAVTAIGTNSARVRVTSAGTYSYRVSAFNSFGESVPSTNVPVNIGSITVPTQPTGLVNTTNVISQ